MKRTIRAVDLFAGAGGTSTGLIQAVADLGFNLELTAINHWDVAIDTHTLNHPGVSHIPHSLYEVNPLEVVPGRYLDLLIASPECTHHSNARGGKPMDEQSRAGAEFVAIWAEKIYIETILIENVKEFLSWGPLDQNQRPIQKYKGQLFLNFIERLRAMDYNVDYRLINAANYGDATTRERLFIIARKGGKPIVWPEISHSKDGQVGFLGKPKWRPARDIIDWDLKGKSIFTRKRPLRPNTMRRIFRGLEKFGCAPFLAEYHGQKYQGDDRVRSIDRPLPTVDTSNRFAFIEPFIVMMYGTSNVRSINQPLPTVTAQGEHLYLCEPYIVSVGGPAGQGRNPHPVSQPLGTILADDHRALVEPFIISMEHSRRDRTFPVDRPLPTITGTDAWAVVEPYLIKYNGSGLGAHSIDESLDTITSKDRFGLVIPLADGNRALVDILFRMLTPKELAAAMSFPPDYIFTGTRDNQVKQIGNAVAVRTAKALTKSLIQEEPCNTNLIF